MEIPIKTSGEKNLQKLADQISDIVGELVGRNFLSFRYAHEWNPGCNLYETCMELILCFDLAGVVKEQISLTYENEQIIVSGNRPSPWLPDMPREAGVYCMEIESGPFRRVVELPAEVKVAEIAARYEDGLLWVRLPLSTPLEEDQG